MHHLPKEVQDRIEKIEKLREMGEIPFKERYETNTHAKNLLEIDQKTLPNAEKVIAEHKGEQSIAGRIITARDHGKLAFAQLQDQTGRIQICFMKDILGADKYSFSQKMIDVGDYVGIDGDLFVTNHGETTLLVTEFELLSKAIRPLPEKWHGLADQETKYRKRYLDMISDPETLNRMLLRPKLMQTIREFLLQHNFIEVETPILSSSASGALAKPFITHHNALDQDFYLRIAPETSLKKTVAGGIERVFEFAKCFRNEGIAPTHLQEFTMLEYYASYWNYEDNMKFTEQLMEHITKTLFGTTKVKWQGREYDFKAPYKRVSLQEIIKKDCGIDYQDHETAESLLKAINEKGIQIEDADNLGRGNLIDALYKKVSRPNITDPIFLIHHPVDLSPLARLHDEDHSITDRFQLVVGSAEIVNAYSELIDPIDQKERFEAQSKAKEGGDEEAMMYDHAYLEAMEHGMPPMSGWGMGIDRLMTLLTDQDNLKDTILFPLLRPTKEEQQFVPQADSKNDSKITPGFTREQAITAIDKYVDPKLQPHLYFMEATMRHLASHFGHPDEADTWALAGLVHDIDWSITEEETMSGNPLAHCGEKLDEILGQELGATSEFIEAVRSHYGEHNIPLDTKLKKVLFAVDELTGFIVAVTLVRPSKKMDDVEVKSVKKKFKDKGFAAKVDRSLILTCEENLNTPIDEFIQLTLDAMKPIASNYGL